MQIVSSLLPFPPICWWAYVIDADLVIFDVAEHFEKMSYRNRYKISGANNPIQLSVPLVSGRDQRTAMSGVRIFNDTSWQQQHWRTLVSVYKQTPFWDHFEPGLKNFFELQYMLLTDFNRAPIHWAMQQLKVNVQISETSSFVTKYPSGIKDIRAIRPGKENLEDQAFPRYYQVFEDRVGFLPNLSILDLIFSEGPQAKKWIMANKEILSIY